MRHSMHRLALLLVTVLLLAACTPVRPLENAPGSEQPAADAPAAAAPDPLVETLASALDVTAAEVTIVSQEAVEWPDACLGVTEEGEMCAQVITPGYRIVVESGGQQYTLHTDLSGSSVRRAADGETPGSEGSSGVEDQVSLTYAGPAEMGSDDVSLLRGAHHRPGRGAA